MEQYSLYLETRKKSKIRFLKRRLENVSAIKGGFLSMLHAPRNTPSIHTSRLYLVAWELNRYTIEKGGGLQMTWVLHFGNLHIAIFILATHSCCAYWTNIHRFRFDILIISYFLSIVIEQYTLLSLNTTNFWQLNFVREVYEMSTWKNQLTHSGVCYLLRVRIYLAIMYAQLTLFNNSVYHGVIDDHKNHVKHAQMKQCGL